MGWYATWCEFENFWYLEETEVLWLYFLEQVQFFTDNASIEDDGEHMRGSHPNDVERIELYLFQLWCEIA